MLPTIQLVSHRCFRDRADFELRPLSLLYGRNQAGKSTLIRLLPLLGDALASNRGPLDMTSPALRGATFKELGWLGPGMESTLRFTFSTSAGAAIRLDVVEEKQGPLVNRIRAIEGDKVAFSVSWDGPSAEQASPFAARYKGTSGGKDWEGDLEFRALFPASLPDRGADILSSVRKAAAPIEAVQWLQANRLPSSKSPGTRPSRSCSADGSDLAVILRRYPEVVSAASDWLGGQDVALGGLTLGQDTEGAVRFEVRPHLGWETLPLRLAGEGLRALLPVLLSACWAESGLEDAPRMLAVEEPEAQLHPRLQIRLADKLIESATSGIPIVAETHSVYVLRAMQRAVLQGRIAPEQVALYWVSQSDEGAASLTRIAVREDASLEGWPPGVLEEEQALAREIFDERWAREAAK